MDGGAPPVEAQRAAYLRAKAAARAWLDRLEVDCADLQRHNVKGKKKLAEILDAYLSLYRHAPDAAEREGIRKRVEALTQQTRRPEYHNLRDCPEAELTQNSMSYLRVLVLMDEFGLDTNAYREEVRRAKPRLDAHIEKRGPWQRAMFREYYDKLGLELPPVLTGTPPMEEGVISRRAPVAEIDDRAAYDLTHEVFVAFHYGLERKQTKFGPADLEYARWVFPALVARYVERRNPDLVGELVSCMTYLGWRSDPACRRGIEYLLASQNLDGSWGSYERHRPTYGKYLEQHVYLHTTMVVLDALIHVFEGNWDRAVEDGVSEQRG